MPVVGFLRSHSLCLRVDTTISLLGVQHFGCEGGEYKVSSEVTDVTRGSSQVKTSGTYSCEKDMDYAYYGFDVLFTSPVILEPGNTYKIISNIEGPESWYGEQGRVVFETAGVGFTVSMSDHVYDNGTSATTGQFPGFLFEYSG